MSRALIASRRENALAVRIIRNANPGGTKDKAGETVNGGALGRDNPTYHASAGWDWMSTIRGRNDGIWDNVTLTTSGPVTIENPLVTQHAASPRHNERRCLDRRRRCTTRRLTR